MAAKSYSEQPELHTKAPYRAAMLTYPGNLRQALKDAQEDASKTLFGVAHGIPSTFVTKMLASTKPDFIWMDVEHGMFNRLQLHDAIHAAQHHSEGHSMVVVRVPKHDEISLTTALDAGAAGIIIPHCESAQEVKDFIQEMYYGPIGKRSFSPWTFTPGLTSSLYPNDPFNVQTSNNHICIIPQIESVKGVENVEEIAAVPGVHGLFFGPGDFMIDAGIDLNGAMPGSKPDPRFLEAMGKFGAAAAKNNLPVFGGAMTLDMIPMLIENGMRAICVQFDVWGFSRLVASSLQTGREAAAKFKKDAKPEENGNDTKQ